MRVFNISFKEEHGSPWKKVQVDCQKISDLPENFHFAYKGVYRNLDDCVNVKIEYVPSCEHGIGVDRQCLECHDPSKMYSEDFRLPAGHGGRSRKA